MYFIDFIIYPLVYIIFTPLLALLHELGHAIPALIFTKGEVIINLGNSNLNKTIKLNRLVINLNGYKSLLDVCYGYVNWTPIDSTPIYNRIKLILMTLGGPLTTLLISISLYIYLINSSLPYILMLSFNGLFLFSAFEFLITILPIKYSYRPYVGCTSDGYKILQYLKRSN